MQKAALTRILALDFGGSKHTIGVLQFTGSLSPGALLSQGWSAHQLVHSPPNPTVQSDLRIIFRTANKLLKGTRPGAIGVSFGGPVDWTSGTVRLSHHVPGWENTPLAEILQAEFNAPAYVDNDANVAALGEYQFGAGQGCQSLFYITVSTGVGGGWIINGRPWRGADGMAGEIGHTVVDPAGPLCLCGKRGCVERLASGPYMAEDARQLLECKLQNGGASGLPGNMGDLPPERGGKLLELVDLDLQKISAKTLSLAAESGDTLAWGLLERSAQALGVGIGAAANLVNPQRFILGGGVTKAGESYWKVIQQTARQTALPQIGLEIVPASLGDDAPLWGAVALALEGESLLSPKGTGVWKFGALP